MAGYSSQLSSLQPPGLWNNNNNHNCKALTRQSRDRRRSHAHRGLPSEMRDPDTGDAGHLLDCRFSSPLIKRLTKHHELTRVYARGSYEVKAVEKEKTSEHKACETNHSSRPFTRDHPTRKTERIIGPTSKTVEKERSSGALAITRSMAWFKRRGEDTNALPSRIFLANSMVP